MIKRIELPNTPKDLSDKVNEIALEIFSYYKDNRMRGIVSYLPLKLALKLKFGEYPFNFRERDSIMPQFDNKDFLGCIQKSREGGLKDIHSKIKEINHEHMWLYLPENEVWIDNTLFGYDVGVLGNDMITVFLSEIYSRIEMVHIHPDIPISDLYKKGKVGGQFSENYLIEIAKPSIEDLMFYVNIDEISNNKCSFISSIVSHYGVTSYEFNQIGRNIDNFMIMSENNFYLVDKDKDTIENPIEEIERLLKIVENECCFDLEEYFTNRIKIPVFDIWFKELLDDPKQKF